MKAKTNVVPLPSQSDRPITADINYYSALSLMAAYCQRKALYSCTFVSLDDMGREITTTILNLTHSDCTVKSTDPCIYTAVPGYAGIWIEKGERNLRNMRKT